MLIYAVYDGALDPALIWRDLGERRTMAIGLVALLLLRRRLVRLRQRRSRAGGVEQP